MLEYELARIADQLRIIEQNLFRRYARTGEGEADYAMLYDINDKLDELLGRGKKIA